MGAVAGGAGGIQTLQGRLPRFGILGVGPMQPQRSRVRRIEILRPGGIFSGVPPGIESTELAQSLLDHEGLVHRIEVRVGGADSPEIIPMGLKHVHGGDHPLRPESAGARSKIVTA